MSSIFSVTCFGRYGLKDIKEKGNTEISREDKKYERKTRKGGKKYRSLGRYIYRYRSMKGERNSKEVHLEKEQQGIVNRKKKKSERNETEEKIYTIYKAHDL